MKSRTAVTIGIGMVVAALTSACASVADSAYGGNAPADRLSLKAESGQYWCVATDGGQPTGTDSVACQGVFPQTGETGFHTVTTDGHGSLRWSDGNILADEPALTMTDGQTITFGNWSIHHDPAGTRFTNTSTRRGMLISSSHVYAF